MGGSLQRCEQGLEKTTKDVAADGGCKASNLPFRALRPEGAREEHLLDVAQL